MKTSIQPTNYDYLKCPTCSRFVRKGPMTAPIWEMTLSESEWCQCDNKPQPIFQPKSMTKNEPAQKSLLYRVNDRTLPHLFTLCAAIAPKPYLTVLFAVILVIWFVRDENK